MLSECYKNHHPYISITEQKSIIEKVNAELAKQKIIEDKIQQKRTIIEDILMTVIK